MASRRKHGRVFVLDLIPPAQDGLFDNDPRSILTQRIVRGARVTRYRREWIIGPTEQVGDVLSGRIGFVGEGPTAELWDEAKKDFVDEEMRTGLTAPFAVDVENLTAVVQDRGQMITVDAAAGALQDILSEGAKDPLRRWQIRSRVGVDTLTDWLRTVSKVTKASLTVRIPNPSYRDAVNLKELMEQTEAEVIRLEMESEEGIDIAAPFVAESQGHIDRGYGDARYSGVIEDSLGNTHRSVFSTRVGVEIPHELLETDEHGEVTPAQLRTQLARVATLDRLGDGADRHHELSDRPTIRPPLAIESTQSKDTGNGDERPSPS